MSNDLKQNILSLLAKEFEYSQALHSEREDIIRKLDLQDDSSVNDALQSLQQDGLISLWIDHRGKIKLAKITWRGLNKVDEVHLRYGMDRSTL